MRWIKAKKTIAVVLIILLAVNLVMYALKISSAIILWAVILVIAIIAFYIMPKIK